MASLDAHALSGKGAVILSRVSTDEQAKSGLGLADQVERCRDYLERANIGVLDVLSDEGISGGTMARPALKKALAYLAYPECVGICVLKTDRLSRKMLDAQLIKEEIQASGKELFVVDESCDLNAPDGELAFNLRVAFAEHERRQISMRTQAAMDQMKKNGYYTGGHVPVGLKVVWVENTTHKKLVRDPDVAPLIEPIWQMAISGKSVLQIVEYLKSVNAPVGGKGWYSSKVWTLLKNNSFKGLLVSEEDFIQAEMVMGSTSCPMREERKPASAISVPVVVHPNQSHQKVAYRLKGMIRCAECGEVMVGKTAYGNGGRQYRYYACNGKLKKLGCKAKDVPCDPVDKVVVETLAQMVDEGVVDALAEDHVRHSERSGKLSAQAQKLTFQRDHIGAQRDRLVQAIKEGAPVAALSKEMDALQTKWDALDRQVQELLAEINEGDYTLSQLEEARSNLSQGLRFIASKGTAEQQTMFLQEFVEEVRVARSVEQLVVKANIAAPLNQTQNNEPVSKGTRVRTLSLMARKSGQRMKCSPA